MCLYLHICCTNILQMRQLGSRRPFRFSRPIFCSRGLYPCFLIRQSICQRTSVKPLRQNFDIQRSRRNVIDGRLELRLHERKKWVFEVNNFTVRRWKATKKRAFMFSYLPCAWKYDIFHHIQHISAHFSIFQHILPDIKKRHDPSGDAQIALAKFVNTHFPTQWILSISGL